jgi:hypothetical protein
MSYVQNNDPTLIEPVAGLAQYPFRLALARFRIRILSFKA